jgi:hypothetical protein
MENYTMRRKISIVFVIELWNWIKVILKTNTTENYLTEMKNFQLFVAIGKNGIIHA